MKKQANNRANDNIVLTFRAATDPTEREQIVRSIDNSHSSDTSSLLLEALSDRDSFVRIAAMETIAAAQLEDMTAPIIEILRHDRNVLARVTAAENLGDIGNPEAVPALLKALSDRNYLVRGWAANSLARFPSTEVINALLQLLASEKYHFVRVSAMYSLIILGEKTLLPDLLSELKYSNYHVRCAAVNSLVEVADSHSVAQVLNAFEEALTREKTIAVKSAIYSALSQLCKIDMSALHVLEDQFQKDPDDPVIGINLSRAYLFTNSLQAAKDTLKSVVAQRSEVREWILNDPDLRNLISPS